MIRFLGPFTLRRAITVTLLTAGWCTLWGSLTFANAASGAVVGFLASSRYVGTRAAGGIRPLPLLQFGAIVAWDLVVSTVSVAREILTPTDYTEEGIIAVEVPTSMQSHLLLIIIAVTVTPGTAIVDADPDRSILYLHLLHADQAEKTAAHVQHLSDLACRALPNSIDPEVTA